jgi:uncharacterized RDD family membrane protein YckC
METKEFLPFILNWTLPVIAILFMIGFIIKFQKMAIVNLPDNQATISVETKASFFFRLVALWIDIKIFTFLHDALLLSLPSGDLNERYIIFLQYFLFIIYKIGFEYKHSITFGKLLLGIEVKSETGHPLQFLQIVKRNIIFIAILGIMIFVKSGFFSKWDSNAFPFNSFGVLGVFIILPLILNSLWYFYKEEGLTLQDRFGSTQVMKTSGLHRYFWWILLCSIVLETIIKNQEKWL